jgi:hypothetical protein
MSIFRNLLDNIAARRLKPIPVDGPFHIGDVAVIEFPEGWLRHRIVKDGLADFFHYDIGGAFHISMKHNPERIHMRTDELLEIVRKEHPNAEMLTAWGKEFVRCSDHFPEDGQTVAHWYAANNGNLVIMTYTYTTDQPEDVIAEKLRRVEELTTSLRWSEM